ncbi:MAG: primosomal protein N' [Gammaproteobacteria bacterium]|nr:primosomal protein N' [Gammaproteobacteria bacterium]
MTRPNHIVRVALKTPVDHLFDYTAPASGPTAAGTRVRVPFGRGNSIGVVVETDAHSSVAPEKLRPVTAVLDEKPLLDETLISLLRWAADYYQHPPGEVFAAALPALLRQGRALDETTDAWRCSEAGPDIDHDALQRRAPRQAAALTLLGASDRPVTAATLDAELGRGWRPIVRNLEKKGWVRRVEVPIANTLAAIPASETGRKLTRHQQTAVNEIRAANGFAAFLLYGVTGSGKTEVYLQLIDELVGAGGQALVLVPEIGLTPQLVERFRRRLGGTIAVMHSGLNESERLAAWRAAADGSADVVVGTRSAVFVPLARPKLIVVDEEHDTSYKQQEGFRYSARDLAVLRAQRHGIRVVLGSATPSLESLHNVSQDRYRQLELPARPGAVAMPKMRLIDMRREPVDAGFSASLVAAMREHLAAGDQVLLFLNRRGFAPAWFCPECGWISDCRRCDARMTLHRAINRLRCHHCGSERAPEKTCPECDSEPQPVGLGTQRVEETMARLFPEHAIARIDRDSTRRRGTLEQMLGEIHAGQRQILIGTQMLTKGHHFPGVTLVGIVDADQGLFGTDPRSNERLAQLVIQVAGRAGRAEKPGEVLVQTQYPEHPLLNMLATEGYTCFAAAALAEREATGWPPYAALALLRADASDEQLPLRFLAAARELANPPAGVRLLGPAAAPMPRRAGRYRSQLLIQGARKPLHIFLQGWKTKLTGLPDARRIRWSLDIDPVELF